MLLFVAEAKASIVQALCKGISAHWSWCTVGDWLDI